MDDICTNDKTQDSKQKLFFQYSFCFLSFFLLDFYLNGLLYLIELPQALFISLHPFFISVSHTG